MTNQDAREPGRKTGLSREQEISRLHAILRRWPRWSRMRQRLDRLEGR